MPNGVARVYPASGAVAMLLLTPVNKYTPTVLFCGGFDMPADYHGNYSWPFYVSLQNLWMALRRHTNRTMTCSRAVPWVSSLPSPTGLCSSSTVLRTEPLGSLTRLSTHSFSRPDALLPVPRFGSRRYACHLQPQRTQGFLLAQCGARLVEHCEVVPFIRVDCRVESKPRCRA